jgi:AbrB family looped-hinge helix DNA binding protein
MDTTLDRFGRVVIPKRVREALGLRAGDSLQVEPSGDAVVLKPLRAGSCLAYQGRVLVYTGEIVGEDTDIVRRHREERMRKLMHRSGR